MLKIESNYIKYNFGCPYAIGILYNIHPAIAVY